ncbi:MAG: potassium transporter TrkG [Methylomonas sp.]|nr:potassium transporter TrkG [Methylomonas sp.]
MSFSDVSRALAQPVRYGVIGRYLARIGLVIVVLKLVPILLAGFYRDWSFMMWQLLALTGLGACCLPLVRLPVPDGIRDNEVMVISVLSFVLAAVFEALPLLGEGLNGIDALFETVSGVTTTGLSMMTNLDRYSGGVLFARAWMQWYGGLGIVAFSIALSILDQGVAARRLAMGDNDSRDILGNARNHSLKLLGIYCGLTAIMIILLWLLGASPFCAVTHVLSGVSTGGFSIYDASLAAVEPRRLQFIIMLSGVLGAISLPFYYRLLRNGVKELAFTAETLVLLALSLVMIALLFYGADHQTGDLASRLQDAVITGLSAQTTTGFASVKVAELNDAAKLTLIISMAIGGSTGSTAGGIKILRFLIVLRLLQFFIVRTALPAHAVLERRLGGDKLESNDIERALLLVFVCIATVLCSWLPFLMMGYAPMDALFEVVSACSTTGLSAGITRVELEPGLKLVLIADMLLGRVEFLAFLLFLYPRTWFKLGSKV